MNLFDEVLAVIFSPRCVACGNCCSGSLCADCRPGWPIESEICDRCGEALPQAMQVCGDCLRFPSALTRTRSQFWLEDTSRAVIHKVKFGGHYELLALFRPAFESSFKPYFPDDISVVPVPLHPERLLSRGFNQSDLLAGWIAKLAGLRKEALLRKTTETTPQSTLGVAARAKNLRRSFEWKEGALRRSVLLVDDIYTSGATLRECARVAKKAGVEEVFGWTLLRTPAKL